MDNVKIYCGNGILPNGYGRFGTRNECLKCGFGAAMMQYKWAPSSHDPRPPPRSKKGCYRPRNRPMERGTNFKNRTRRSPRRSPRRTRGSRRRRSRSRSLRRLSTRARRRRSRSRSRQRRSKLNGGMNTPSPRRARTRLSISPAEKIIKFVLTPAAIRQAQRLQNETIIMPGTDEDHILAAYEIDPNREGFTRTQLESEMLVFFNRRFLSTARWVRIQRR